MNILGPLFVYNHASLQELGHGGDWDAEGLDEEDELGRLEVSEGGVDEGHLVGADHLELEPVGDQLHLLLLLHQVRPGWRYA